MIPELDKFLLPEGHQIKGDIKTFIVDPLAVNLESFILRGVFVLHKLLYGGADTEISETPREVTLEIIEGANLRQSRIGDDMVTEGSQIWLHTLD